MRIEEIWREEIPDIVSRSWGWGGIISWHDFQIQKSKKTQIQKKAKKRRNEKLKMEGGEKCWQSAMNILVISSKSPKIDQGNDDQKCLATVGIFSLWG